MAALNLQELTGYGLPTIQPVPQIQYPSLIQARPAPQVPTTPLGLSYSFSPKKIEGPITYRDGELYSGDYKINPLDQIGYTYTVPANEWSNEMQEKGWKPAYQASLEELFPVDTSKLTRKQLFSGSMPLAIPSGLTVNPLADDPIDPLVWFSSDPIRRSGLYGNYISSEAGAFDDDSVSPNPLNYKGETYTEFKGRGGRGATAQTNADYVLKTLANMFPNATAEQLDRAAIAARYRDDWPARYGRNYYAANQNDIIRAIAKQLPGGLPKNYDELLAKSDQQMAARGNAARKAAHAADDADDGLGGFGNLLGMAASFALGPAGFGLMPAWGAGAIGGGLGGLLSGGDPLKGALFGGIGAGVGGELTGMLGDATGLGFLSNDFVGPLTVGEAMTKSAISGGLSGLLRGTATGNPLQGALQGAFTGGAGSAISGLDMTGIPNIDSAIERGLVNIGGAGLFGGDMDSALLGTALNTGFAGFGNEIGLTPGASSNVANMINKILKSNMTASQKKKMIADLQKKRSMGMMGIKPTQRMAA